MKSNIYRAATSDLAWGPWKEDAPGPCRRPGEAAAGRLCAQPRGRRRSLPRRPGASRLVTACHVPPVSPAQRHAVLPAPKLALGPTGTSGNATPEPGPGKPLRSSWPPQATPAPSGGPAPLGSLLRPPGLPHSASLAGSHSASAHRANWKESVDSVV